MKKIPIAMKVKFAVFATVCYPQQKKREETVCYISNNSSSNFSNKLSIQLSLLRKIKNEASVARTSGKQLQGRKTRPCMYANYLGPRYLNPFYSCIGRMTNY